MEPQRHPPALGHLHTRTQGDESEVAGSSGSWIRRLPRRGAGKPGGFLHLALTLGRSFQVILRGGAPCTVARLASLAFYAPEARATPGVTIKDVQILC